MSSSDKVFDGLDMGGDVESIMDGGLLVIVIIISLFLALKSAEYVARIY